MITLRVADTNDAVRLSELLCSSIRELCEADHGNKPDVIAAWTANKTPENLVGWIGNSRLTLILAERNQEPAGLGGICHDGEVLLNYVTPSHRYSGISDAILRRLEDELVRQGIENARLTSTETAHQFYLDRGWRDTGEPERKFGVVGFPMEKTL